VSVHRELRKELIAARNWKPPWSTKAFVRTVGEIEHHDVVHSGIFADEFPDKYSREWTIPAWITWEEATQLYIVEAIAEFHF